MTARSSKDLHHSRVGVAGRSSEGVARMKSFSQALAILARAKHGVFDAPMPVNMRTELDHEKASKAAGTVRAGIKCLIEGCIILLFSSGYMV